VAGDSSGQWRLVNRRQPCLACGSTDWCAWSPDGKLLKCERSSETPHGMLCVKLRDGGALFRRADDNGNRRANHRPGPRSSQRAATEWKALAECFTAAMPADRLADLAGQLGVTLASLQSISVGYVAGDELAALRARWEGDAPDMAFTFPEQDGSGRIIGLSLRAQDGRKSAPTGSRRGLIVPSGLSKLPNPVLIVEGATDVAACEVLGLGAVGRPSNSGGWEQLAELLNDRDVLIVGENDAKDSGLWPGRDGAKTIAARIASERGEPVKWTLPPDGAKDVRSWLRARIAKGLDLANTEACKAAGSELLAALQDLKRKEKPDRSPTQADSIVDLAFGLYRFGVSTEGEAFAVPCNGPNIAMMFRGSRDALRTTLAREYRRRYRKTPSASALADALNVLAGEARDHEPEAVYLRVAEHEGGIALDLGSADGSAVSVKPEGWQIVGSSPVLFRRTVLTGGLPKPERGGSVDELRELLNVSAETWPLVLGWLVSGYIPSIPHVILLLGGEQGTGKSTTARFLFSCFDPSPAPLRTAPRDAEQWSVTAAASWGVCLDNVSGISEWLSDTLCRAVTGDGFPKRTLYTDSDVTVLAFRRVLCITSIDAGALKGDFGERVILADLERIDAGQRRTEADLEALFAKKHSRILGVLLDLLSGVLRESSRVKLTTLPRMADFARILAALDATIGAGALARYLEQSGRVAAEVVEADHVGAALTKAVGEEGILIGTAGELLDRIRPKGVDAKPERLGTDWPKSPAAMGRRLRRLAPSLRAAGIAVEVPTSTDKTRRYTLKSAPNAQTPETGLAGRDNGKLLPGNAISITGDEYEESTTDPSTGSNENVPSDVASGAPEGASGVLGTCKPDIFGGDGSGDNGCLGESP